MEIVRFAPTLDLEPDLQLEHGKTHIVHSARLSKLSGVLFELVGFTSKESGKYYSFPASHFRAPNGKRAGLVTAKPGTEAYAEFGDVVLYLIKIANVQGVECIWCQEYKQAKQHLRSKPYNQFEHV